MKLKEARKRKLLTVEELASQSGVSVSAINKIEQGAWLPSLKTIRKIAPILGIEPVEVEEFKAAIEKIE
ncbi:MAG TPA: helix-turn-helix transcriptional regulator [Treponema sp.]|jgi:putative transcriptional regulator|nr:helix-turn-helix transcriptional regulator [Treponema sp.]